MSEKKQIVIALAGNPNAGKTSLFNKLTGLRAHVGNYPGVTVEQKWGEFTHNGRTVKVVDLPGTYSLNSYSLDERVARDFVINERPDLVVNVVDATNLERNLYLTLQFLELGLPTVIALNMMDLAGSKGINIDTGKLAQDLGARVVPVVATSGKGMEDLLNTIVEAAEAPSSGWKPIEISYGQDIDEAIGRVEELMSTSSLPLDKMPLRWLAVKYLEGDPAVDQLITTQGQALLPRLEPIKAKLAGHLRTTVDDELEGVMTDRRYGFISGLRRIVVNQTRQDTREISDTIDKVLLNRLFAPFFFLAVIYGLYQFTFWASEPVVGWLEAFFEFLGETVESGMSEGLLKDLLLEGIIGGVGGVVGFAPLIAFMFVGISILEDSGYMARVAFIVDRVFRAFGLHGNSVVAMIVGGGIAGGCAIPGVMATRTLRDPKERIATILVTPFMTCGAKLPVFLMLVAAFFQDNQALVMVGLTIFAWLIALISAKILRVFVLPGESAPFVLELPPYRMPTLSGVLLHAWERTWSYIKKAGTVIVAITIIIWLMMTFPSLPEERQAVFDGRVAAVEETMASNIETYGEEEAAPMNEELAGQIEAIELEAESATLRNSAAGRIGGALEPLSQLIGFDWRTNIALVGGFAAKEVVLSTLGTAYAMAPGAAPAADEAGIEAGDGSAASDVAATAVEEEEEDEEEALIRTLAEKLSVDPAWSPLAAISLMVFVLIYAPCFVTIAVIGKEIGYKWAAFSLIASTAWAYVLCLVIFQGGRMMGWGI
ncbi:ferrous iron transport protein B [Deltaproteobacteria bacterium Smac51]|nr:ferrous iron transport protein B [Deltaproteobacteria bacterium Smac51]